jgi:single-stranded-DNA-specific exonuclease
MRDDRAPAGDPSTLLGMTEARPRFTSFVESLARDARTVVLHDSDADGVTSGVVLVRTLERLGFTDVRRVIPTRERDAWNDANRALVAAQEPRALFVLDLGVRGEPLVENVPACFVDHHRPAGVPPDAVVISAYTWDPIPNTSLIVYDLCAAIADVRDLDWIAAIGVLSDLGERAPFELLAEVKKRYTMKDLKEATALINAARRASEYQPEAAARALLDHASPRELVTSEAIAPLRAAREEVNREMALAKMAAPKFSGNVALVRVRSRCQVHPLIAQIWRSRLPKYLVLVANDGYLPGRVNFSMRSAAGINLNDFLSGHGLAARGHDQAAGGSVSEEEFAALLQRLGFA